MKVTVVNEATKQTVVVTIPSDSKKPTTHAILAAFDAGFDVCGALVTYWDENGKEILGNH